MSIPHPQSLVVNDVDISPNPKELFFDKHIEYIVEHEKDKDDFVSSPMTNQSTHRYIGNNSAESNSICCRCTV